LKIAGVELECLLDSGGEVSLIGYEVLMSLDSKCHEEMFLSVQGISFQSVGTADFTLGNEHSTRFVAGKIWRSK
jgi:hypothetical protein